MDVELATRLGVREPPECLQGFVDARQCLTAGTPGPSVEPRSSEIGAGLVPGPCVPVVSTDGRAVGGEIRRIDDFQSAGDLPVEHCAAGTQQTRVGDLTDAVVAEVEAAVRLAQDATADQLLHSLR